MAATYTWAGVSAPWASANFWNVDGVPYGSAPDYADVALIAAAGSYTVSSNDSRQLVSQLTISSATATLQTSGLFQAGLLVSGGVENAGTIRVTAGSTFEVVTGSFGNTGVMIVESSATLLIDTAMSSSSLAGIQNSGLVKLNGTVDNVGGTISALALGRLTLSGAVSGGVVRNDGGTLLFATTNSGPFSLQGVIFQGLFSPPDEVRISGGLTVQNLAGVGSGTITLAPSQLFAGAGGVLHFTDAETLDNVVLNMPLGGIFADAPLTLGSNANLVVSSTGSLKTIQGSGLRNDGSISNTGLLTISSTSFSNAGVLTSSAGSVIVSGTTLANSGTIAVSGGSVTIQHGMSGTGLLSISGGSTMTLNGGYGAEGFQFAGSGNYLSLSFITGSNTMLGFGPGDTLFLKNTPADVVFAGGTLTISNSGIKLAQFLMPDVPAAAQFVALTDSDGNTSVTESVACFAAGTRIATHRGPIAVELLAVDDRVLLAPGGTAPVQWLGHRRIDLRGHPRPQDVQPVRVRAHAFGNGLPERDLLLSPDHAVFVDGVLIPVRYLLNGRSIVQQRMAAVTYFHVELPAHAVLLAEGLPCESYLDTGNRTAFANGGGALQLHPDFSPVNTCAWTTAACAELVLEGQRVADAKEALLALACNAGDSIIDDPNLAVLADGQPLPASIGGTSWTIRIPPRARRLRLQSRSWIPAHMRGAETDTRRLGVALANLAFNGRPIPLNDSRLSSGWHPAEADWRWTDGDAGIALAGAGELAFDVVMTGRYWADREPCQRLEQAPLVIR